MTIDTRQAKEVEMNKEFMESVKKVRDVLFPPVHPAGWPFIAVFALVTAILMWIWSLLGLVGLVATIWCFYFFRDPKRVTPSRDGLIISPACGHISSITPNVALPVELDQAENKELEFTRVSIFLNVFDVHVNRFPIIGKVIQKEYKEGAFVNAAFDKASEENERAAILFETEYKDKKYEMAVVQIAGWVARRILCDAEEGSIYKTGERFGIIRFGSRVDVYLPKGVNPMVAVGQRMIEGETVLADFASKEKVRDGAIV
jgi:phosphatidylserine decarboxylase